MQTSYYLFGNLQTLIVSTEQNKNKNMQFFIIRKITNKYIDIRIRKNMACSSKKMIFRLGIKSNNFVNSIY